MSSTVTVRNNTPIVGILVLGLIAALFWLWLRARKRSANLAVEMADISPLALPHEQQAQPMHSHPSLYQPPNDSAPPSRAMFSNCSHFSINGGVFNFLESAVSPESNFYAIPQGELNRPPQVGSEETLESQTVVEPRTAPSSRVW
ncbi:hypothetical protein B0H13DRAFT_1895139 [Mycena leptocephala]|nr:hypothetical protein B0H13DRAFT_1895139 [Mycena leptocephala]